MLRLIVALVLIVALAAGAVWLVENPGFVDFQWGGWRIQTSAPVVIVGLIVLVGIVLAIYRIIGWVLAGPSRIRAYFEGGRSEKGHKALTEGMAAIASGDWRRANKAADRAEKFLDNPPMARLLKAQAAQLAGDEPAAEGHFRSMLDSPETELVAVRGLLIQAGHRGDHDRALELAKRAHRLRPDAGWAQRALFDLQTAGADWDGATQTLVAAIRSGVYDKDRGQHLRAVIELAQSREQENAGHLRPALSYAEAAIKHDPDHVPALVAEGRLHKAAGHDRKAARHLKDAWARLHHPALAQAMAELKPDEDPIARLRRFEDINKSDMDNAEVQLVLGRLALEADNPELAREYALSAASRAHIVDQRFCRLVVDAFERTKDGAEKARDWLVKLADAPQPPRWQCVSCNAVAAAWEPHCPSCHQFDGLEWREAEPIPEAVLLVEQRDDHSPADVPLEEAVTDEDGPPTRR
ncbi:MAG: heme biosynthesis protein HemY [Minwuia sp.]|uniref:heme biosynthesis protein HemY n=1 Tax=Minwuia sp. TaxID=2493630 RepID=UPI003A89648C